MKKNTMNKILNPILLVLFINQAVSVVFREHFTRETFRIFHMSAGAILLILLLVHFILNFNWVKANYLPKQSS
jgi:hypothetical protein